MKFLIYTPSDLRKNLLMYHLNEVKANSNLQLEFITNLPALADRLLKDEFSIIGGIFDFDEANYVDIDSFFKNAKGLHAKVRILANSHYSLTDLKCFTVEKAITFEKLLLQASNFAFRCESLACYTYKIKINDGKCYLKEFFGDKETNTPEIVVRRYDEKTLCIEFPNGLDTLVIKRMFNPSSNLTNIFGDISKICVIDNRKAFSFTRKYSISEMEEYIKLREGAGLT